MGLTKRNLVDLFIESAAGGIAANNRKYHPRVIEGYIELALNSFIAQEIEEEEAAGAALIDNNWIKTFNNVRIRWDQVRWQCYAKLPAKIISLRNNRSIVQVGWMKQTDSPNFVIQDGSSNEVISKLECYTLPPGVHHALVVGSSLYFPFPEMPKSFADDKKKLMCRLVCSAAAYSDDEELPMPEKRSVEIFSLVQQIMQPMIATRNKVSNDSNPNTI